MPFDFDVGFGGPPKKEHKLSHQVSLTPEPDDDEQLEVTPPDVVAMLGFDPLKDKELNKAYDPSQPRDQAGKWTAAGEITDKQGAKYEVQHSLGVNSEHVYSVLTAGKEIAGARLSHTGKHAVDLGVYDESLRRRGIASALYDYIEGHLGYRLVPSPVHRTEAGQAFWASRKK